jgi:thiazole synthase
MQTNQWQVYGQTLNSRLFIGTALYPSPKVMCDAIQALGVEVITVSLRRQTASDSRNGQ